MVNTFINWLSKYPEFQEPERKTMLDDAIKCYQNGIPRAALLLTYNAFLDAIRWKIIKSSFVPKVYQSYKNPNAWSDVINKLSDEEKFEEELKCQINKQPADSIFDVQTRIHLREDMLYWRRRRNDCAHCKNSTITLSNVCALWTFIMDNYIYFNLEGTLQRCINDYAILYDPKMTKPGRSDDHIFPLLCDAIRSKDDIKAFVEGLIQKLNNSWDSQPFINILHKLLFDTKTQNYTKEYLLAQDKCCVLDYLENYPEDVSMLLEKDKCMIRELWKQHTSSQSAYAPIFIAILESGLIPTDEIDEAIKTQLDGWAKWGYSIPLTAQNVDVLNKNGFLSIFEHSQIDRLFEDGWQKQKDLCCKTNFYWSILENFGLSTNMANKMIENYNKNGNFPYTLRELILNNYDMISKQLEKNVKENLKSLMEKNKKENPYSLQ